ncbi:hypothetical protein QFC21_006432 [Naganishia friedmannii]|uniref:Uncharacterized protein n=1 Tax=Naganishia friedmannii TaxID=89922 RepID=A0ACC2V313_9TREE|nr:hypothetical protein QFC21_006432 [Naganishia friedmannii]
MAPTIRSLLRGLRFASGILAGLLLCTFSLLSAPLDSDALWDSWMARYGPISSSSSPLIEELGLAEFLRQLHNEKESKGLLKLEAYVVPPEFGVGTKANLSSKDFPRLVIGRGYQYLDLPVSTIIPRPSYTEQEQEGGVFNPAILKMPEGMKEGWEYIVVARGPRVVRKDIWVAQSNRWALEHGLVANLQPKNKPVPPLLLLRPTEIPPNHNGAQQHLMRILDVPVRGGRPTALLD